MTDHGAGRALLISPVLPNPRGVGLARRAWRWVAELSAGHSLDIIVVSNQPQDPPTWPLPGRVVQASRTGAPLKSRNLHEWFDPDRSIAEAIEKLAAGPPPDRILVFRFYLHDVAALLPASWRRRAEIDIDDWESATRLSLAGLALRHGRWRDARDRCAEAWRYARLEREALRTYSTVHVSASEDIAPIRFLTNARGLKATPNQIAPEPGLAPSPPRPDAKTLLFVGALHYSPNDDAVRWIGKSIAPKLRRLSPNVRILVAGHASSRLQSRMARDRLEYLHAPDDLSYAYADASVVIAPLRGGGGTKFKVLEAWLHGRPVVATCHAARGLDAEPERHLLVADGADAFARACARLLADPELAARLARESAELLRSRFLLAAPQIAIPKLGHDNGRG